ATLPDVLAGMEVKTRGAVVVINATRRTLDDLHLQTACAGASPVSNRLPSIPPLTIRKVGFRIEAPASNSLGSCSVQLKLLREQGDKQNLLDSASINLAMRQPAQTHKRTFISSIDGSVQYYSLVPAKTAMEREPPESGYGKGMAAPARPGLVLTLHGAAVEASGQAACFAPKSWVHVVAPTNRRPYGFDWEDWGRLDAMEVLDLTQKELGADPRKTYLT